MGKSDVFLIKYNSFEDQLWTVQYGETDTDQAEDIAYHEDGFIFIAGSTSSEFQGNAYQGGWDGFLTKFDANEILSGPSKLHI